MTPPMTHYERLGVPPTASATEIRDAYRAAARRSHPDRAGEGSAQQMAIINEAYRVLSDPLRRRRYDEALRVTGPASSAAPHHGAGQPGARRLDDVIVPEVHEPARFPWRFMAVLAALGFAVVLFGVIVYEPPPASPVDNILRAGDCVTLSEALEAAEISCTAEHDATVRVLVPFDQACPAETEPYRDRQGMGWACVVRSASSARST